MAGDVVSHQDGSASIAGRALTAGTIIAGAVIFMALALINGAPFVFWDTSLYFALGQLTTTADPAAVIVALQNDPTLAEQAFGAAERQELLDRAASHLGMRAVAYALFLDLVARNGSMWLASFIQCLLVSASFWIALRLAWGDAVKRWKFLLLAAALALTTPVSISTPLLMPDIFGAVMILLIAATFLASDQLDKRALALLVPVLWFCLTVHMSHLVMAALFGLGATVVVLAWKRSPTPLIAPLAWLAAVLVGALAINASLTAFAEARIGRDLHRPPHLAARIIDDGPGRAYLAESCEDNARVYCRYAERILTAPIIGGDSMIWKRWPDQGGVYLVEELSVGDELRRDEAAFIRDVIAARPLQQIGASAWNVVRLLRSFRPDGSGWYETGSVLTFSYQEYARAQRQVGANIVLSILPNIASCAEHPLRKCGTVPIASFKLLHYLTVALAGLVTAAAGVGFLVRNGFRPSRLDRAEVFILLIVGGILVNAVVCGVLGGVFDRYQSRVIWMLPALAGALLLFSRDKLAFIPIGRLFRRTAQSEGAR